MASVSKSELRNRLRNRELEPVYFLYGPETHMRDLAAKTIADLALTNPSLRDFNEHRISLAESTLEDVFAAAEQLPLNDEKQVVIADDVNLTKNSRETCLTTDSESVLTNYLSRPAETTVVIFVVDELDKRLKPVKTLLKFATAVEFKELDTREATNFVAGAFDEAGAKADANAVRELVDLAGPNAGKLGVEVGKLVTASMPGKSIDVELVRRLVKHSRALSNFDLTDHLVAGRSEAALLAMKKLLDDGAEPLMLLGLLSYNFRQLCLAKQLMNRGLERSQVAREMRLRGNQTRFFEAARRARPGQFEKTLVRIAETDFAIKTSRATPRLQIEMLVCELATGI